jgi:hypothetical protein
VALDLVSQLLISGVGQYVLLSSVRRALEGGREGYSWEKLVQYYYKGVATQLCQGHHFYAAMCAVALRSKGRSATR